MVTDFKWPLTRNSKSQHYLKSNISETMQDRAVVTVECKRNSHAFYRMVISCDLAQYRVNDAKRRAACLQQLSFLCTTEALQICCAFMCIPTRNKQKNVKLEITCHDGKPDGMLRVERRRYVSAPRSFSSLLGAYFPRSPRSINRWNRN